MCFAETGALDIDAWIALGARGRSIVLQLYLAGAIQSFLASQPEYGPQKVAAKTGIICLGAGPWVVNFNVALKTSDLQQARNIARAVSSRGGAS